MTADRHPLHGKCVIECAAKEGKAFADAGNAKVYVHDQEGNLIDITNLMHLSEIQVRISMESGVECWLKIDHASIEHLETSGAGFDSVEFERLIHAMGWKLERKEEEKLHLMRAGGGPKMAVVLPPFGRCALCGHGVPPDAVTDEELAGCPVEACSCGKRRSIEQLWPVLNPEGEKGAN